LLVVPTSMSHFVNSQSTFFA